MDKKTWYQIQWRRKDHSTWRIDEDVNTATFPTREQAENQINSGGYEGLDVRIVEVK